MFFSLCFVMLICYKHVCMFYAINKLNWINKWCDNNSVFNDCQYGFRDNCSTADAVFILHTSIQKILATNKKLWCIFLDYERAFDTVNRDALWANLISTGLSCKMVNMMKAIYAKVQSCVKLSYNNTVLYLTFEVTIGLKQGEHLPPMLFILFINDISSTIDYNCLTQDDIDLLSRSVILFAVDIVLFNTDPASVQLKSITFIGIHSNGV